MAPPLLFAIRFERYRVSCASLCWAVGWAVGLGRWAGPLGWAAGLGEAQQSEAHEKYCFACGVRSGLERGAMHCHYPRNQAKIEAEPLHETAQQSHGLT